MEGDGVSRGVSAKRGILRVGMIPLVAASFLMPAVAAGPAAAAMANGTIHIVSVGALSMAQNDVVITGVFGDAGTFAVGKSPVVPLHLSKGTLKINFAKGAAAEGAVFAHLSKYTSATTCATVASFSSSYAIVGGTGSYAGAHGSVRMTSSLTGVFPRFANGKCNLGAKASPIGFLNTAQGSGTVSFN